jgi:hypothetical protein
MKLIFSFILFLLTLFVSEITNRFFRGAYTDTTGIFELELNSNNTYTYKYQLGFKYSISEGTWKKSNNVLILNSSLNDLFRIPLTVEENITSQTNFMKFEIINPLPIDTLCSYIIILNDTIVIQDKYGEIDLSKKSSTISSIQVKYLCKEIVQTPYPLRNVLRSEIYKIKTTETNYFRIKWDINYDLMYYETMRNDTLCIKGNEIYWPSHNLILHKSKK